MESNGISNSVYLSMILGVNALRCALGQYDLAVEAGLKGIGLARRLGDENRSRALAANLAFCYCRLGNFREQLVWASIAATESHQACDLQLSADAAYIEAMGYALLGQSTAALNALGSVTELQLKSLTPWSRQCWHLHVADVLQVLGRRREALSAARNATSGDLARLLIEGSAGPYARWKAVLASLSPQGMDEVAKDIETLRARRERLDRIDYLEVLNAKVWLESKVGRVNEDDRQEMWQLLREMPAGVSTQLERLGMLCGEF
jgi:hypothetical protein